MPTLKKCLLIAAIQAAALLVLQEAIASTFIPIKKGAITSIDVLKHTITVDKHVYRVSSKAVYQGAQGFGVLVPGMKIEYFLDNTPAGNSSTITRIIVLTR